MRWVHAVGHSYEDYCSLSANGILYHRSPYQDPQCFYDGEVTFVQAVCVNEEAGSIFVVDKDDHLYYVKPLTGEYHQPPVPVKHTGIMKQVGIRERCLEWRAADHQLYFLDVDSIPINPNPDKNSPYSIQIGPGKKCKWFPKTHTFLQGTNGRCTFISPHVIHLTPFWKDIPLIDVETGETLEIIRAEYNDQLVTTLLVTSSGELWVADVTERPHQLKHIPFAGVVVSVISVHHWFFVACVGGQVWLLGHTRIDSDTDANLADPMCSGWYWHLIKILTDDGKSWW